VASLVTAGVERVEEHLAGLGLDESVQEIAPFCDQLGGAVRAIRCLGIWPDNVEDEFQQSPFIFPDGPWAVSCLSGGLERQREKLREIIRDFIQRTPETHGREERPAPGETELVPTKVYEQRLHERESEVCLWRDSNGEVQIGRTVWVFSPADYSERDLGKPNRPRRRGLLPPKLARQMVNLARTQETQRLLDPFCGSGVILIEGLLLGLEVMGSDFRDEALVQSRENLDWYASACKSPSKVPVPLQKIDARMLSSHVEPLSFDAVVGEGDLGPPIRGGLARKAAVELAKSLERLYVTAFAEIRIVLKPGGRVCLAVPFWQPTEGDPIFLNLHRKLALIGYQPVISERSFEPVLYRRKDQRVGRAIYVLESAR
jgi:tRNA G10  N-methylase Trm11